MVEAGLHSQWPTPLGLGTQVGPPRAEVQVIPAPPQFTAGEAAGLFWGLQVPNMPPSLSRRHKPRNPALSAHALVSPTSASLAGPQPQFPLWT